MNLKRSLLAIITVISLYCVFFALGQSLGEPQVQAQLELYQTNLILNSAQLQTSNSHDEIDSADINKIAQTLVGTDPYKTAENQYKKTLKIVEKSLKQLKSQAEEIISQNPETPRQLLKQNIKQSESLLDDLRLKLGIICAYQNKLDVANSYWNEVKQENKAQIVKSIWSDRNSNPSNLAQEIQEQYNGWFENTNLSQLYRINNNQIELNNVTKQQQELAKKAIYQLISLSILPIFGGIIGISLVVFLLIQLILKKEESILATNANQLWNSPWDGETIWQVLIIGFFFLSQVILPIVIGIIMGLTGFNASALDVRGTALYVLMTYLLMAVGGLTVLYLCLKPFFPLPENWFKLRNKNWYWWGIGGYLTAIPLVFLVSFLNQQIWQGKGGSNPLLLLTLESQDKFALFILFITASIAAPIFEEIMFRGFLLSSLTRYLPVSASIVVSGSIFAIAHLSLAEVIPLTTLGIILGIVYTRSRSLLASIMVHSLWNSGTLFTLFVLGSN